MVEHPTALGAVLIEQGRSQTWLALQLSARLGRVVYQQEVSRWVGGQHTPQRATREAIADVVERHVVDLFPPDDSPEALAA